MIYKIQQILQILIESCVVEYRSIFKAGVVILSVGLIGASQLSTKVIELDFATRKIQFEVEAKENIKVSQASCEKLLTSKAECRLALYRLKNNEISMHLISGFIVYSGFFGLGLVILSSVGFFKERRNSTLYTLSSSS